MLVICFALMASLANPVTVESLLDDMTDLARLATRPAPWYRTEQASSFDRASKSPEENWFANADAGHYLREERRNGRLERVMADLKGPGAVVRIWSANPAGVFRFYFDGEEEARWAVRAQDLLGGKVEPLGDPFAYIAAAGWNLYFPIPYAQGLKITVDDTDDDGARSMYYHVGYRVYDPGTPVTTFRPEMLSGLTARAKEVGETLLRHWGTSVGATRDLSPVIGPGRSHAFFRANTAGTLTEVAVRVVPLRGFDGTWDDPRSEPQTMRHTWLVVEFDGERSIEVPLGDFFGVPAGITPYETYVFSVEKDGWMRCRLPMPFATSARLTIQNRGHAPVQVETRVVQSPYANQTYRLRAQWNADFGGTRPFRDMNYLTAEGEGVFIGSSLHIANPTPQWWGEGDEKIYLDGEAFPSTFGTGTEDYYGYAWCSPELFMRPYHAQPRCDGPVNYGHSIVNRWHVLDPLPYRRSIRFDMEMWHWADVDAVFAYMVIWYGVPGSSGPRSMDPHHVPFPELAPPKPLEGAIEGEDMTVVEVTGGIAEIQRGFFEPSRGEQLWWRNMNSGDRLLLEFEVPRTGRYRVWGNFCRNLDYGIHWIRFAEGPGMRFDFFHTSLVWERFDLGERFFEAGRHRLEVTCVGRREEALPGNMFGLDYLLLEPVR